MPIKYETYDLITKMLLGIYDKELARITYIKKLCEKHGVSYNKYLKITTEYAEWEGSND